MACGSEGPRSVARTLAGVLLLASCWTPQHADGAWQPVADSILTSAAELQDDPVARAILDGIGPLDPATPLHAGDRLLYAIDFWWPAGHERRYLLVTAQREPGDQGALTVNEAGVVVSQLARRVAMSATLTFSWGEVMKTTLESDLRKIAIQVHDQQGEALSSSTADAAVDFLGAGFIDAIERYRELGPALDRDAFRALALESRPVAFAVSELLREDSGLRDLAMRLVDKSLAWTAIWNLGLVLQIETDEDNAEPAAWAPVPDTRAYRMPVQLSVNDRPALRAMALVVEPAGPLGIVAGVVEAAGFRASDDRFRFAARLVAAQRGAADAEPGAGGR
jgi:hypothetical protein